MSAIAPGRMTAAFQGPVTVFVIGMRINRFAKFRQWWPITRFMKPMIEELARNPDSGFLGAEYMLSGLRTVVLIQYWRDFDSLERYARDRDQLHWPAWQAFNKAARNTDAVGVFHETYVVEARASETVYVNMPPFGLGKIMGTVPATGSRKDARTRLSGEGPPENPNSDAG